MRGILDFFKSLFEANWPDGTPLIGPCGRYGTRLLDGSIQFAPGLDAVRLHFRDDQAIEPESAKGETRAIHQETEQPGTPGMTGNLEVHADFGLQRMIEPFTRPEQQQTDAKQDGRREFGRHGGDGDRAAGGCDHLPPLVEADFTEIEVGHASLDSRSAS